MHVVQRVFHHTWGQRPDRPIGLLRMFLKLDIEETFDQRTQTELANPKQPRRNDCVKKSVGGKIQAAPEHSQIVIRSMENNFSRFQCPTQRLEIEVSKLVDDKIRKGRGRYFGRTCCRG